MRPVNPFSDGGDALSIATATSDAELLLSLSEQMVESSEAKTNAVIATIGSECYCQG